MIKVEVIQVANKISELEVKGHAESAEKGKDLVCASVSSIITGLMNVLDEYNGMKTYVMEDGYVKIVVNDINDDEVQLILKVGIIQLKTIQESYSKYIRIIEKEV